MKLKTSEFNSILTQYWPMIQRIISSYEANSDLADELGQEVSLSIWQALRKYRNDATMKTYIARVTHNRCISHVIKATRLNSHESLEEEVQDIKQGPMQLSIEQQKYQSLLTVIRQLPLDERQLITLSLEGFAAKELADIIGITANHASVKLKRTKQKIKTILEEKRS